MKTCIWLLNSAARRICASTAWLIFHKCTKNVCTVVGVSLAGTTLDAAFRETRPAEASGLRAHYFFITYLPSQDLLQSTIRELCASAWLAATWLKRRSMAADDALALFRQHYILYPCQLRRIVLSRSMGCMPGGSMRTNFDITSSIIVTSPVSIVQVMFSLVVVGVVVVCRVWNKYLHGVMSTSCTMNACKCLHNSLKIS